MMDLSVRMQSARCGKTHIFSLGQAGFAIISPSQQILGIDLYLSDCVERIEGHVGFKRLQPHILSPTDIEFDTLIATHAHFDHFDMDSMPILMSNGNTHLYASLNCSQEIARLRMTEERIRYVCPGDYVVDDDFQLKFVPCDHGTAAPDAVGVIISVANTKILIVGDTCLRLDFLEEYLSQGAIDLLIAPINGAYGNMNEKDCANLIDVVQPGLAVPCHYGMFASHGGSPGLFMDIMAKLYPARAFRFMAMGEELIL